MKQKNYLIIILCILISLLAGLLSNDLLLGGTILATGLLNAYFASIGKRINYLLGFTNYLLMSYVALQNHLYGIFFFYLLIIAPLQIKGYLTWNQNLSKENSVIVRKFTPKNSIIIMTSCIIGSILLGYILSQIPNQRLAFLDATSNCINLCGVILMILRFKEAWWLWLFNNIIDLMIWILTTINHGSNSLMMLLVSLGYLLINIYGIVNWTRKTKSNRE